jgi:phosphoglycolate phosphatase-like HAD superfamily hydrolase
MLPEAVPALRERAYALAVVSSQRGRSWMIGDSESDVLAGKAVGCREPASSASRQLTLLQTSSPRRSWQRVS